MKPSAVGVGVPKAGVRAVPAVTVKVKVRVVLPVALVAVTV